LFKYITRRNILYRAYRYFDYQRLYLLKFHARGHGFGVGHHYSFLCHLHQHSCLSAFLMALLFPTNNYQFFVHNTQTHLFTLHNEGSTRQGDFTMILTLCTMKTVGDRDTLWQNLHRALWRKWKRGILYDSTYTQPFTVYFTVHNR